MEPPEPNSLKKHMGHKKKMPIPPKDIGSWTWCLAEGAWRDSHDPGPIMSPHTCITLLSKNAKRDVKKKIVPFVWNKKVDELQMKTKCPKQHGHIPRQEDH